MQLFSFLSDVFTHVDEWVLCTCFSALPLLWFIVCCPLRTRRIFQTFSSILTLIAFILFGCTYSLRDGLLFSLLLCAECLLFDKLIPSPKQKQKEPKKFVCFDEPLPARSPQIPLQPMVTPELATHSIDEANLCLDHAFEVATRLKSLPLSGSDRLETDNVELSLRMYRAKGILTDREMHSLNDCLAVLLKLMAKYEC